MDGRGVQCLTSSDRRTVAPAPPDGVPVVSDRDRRSGEWACGRDSSPNRSRHRTVDPSRWAPICLLAARCPPADRGCWGGSGRQRFAGDRGSGASGGGRQRWCGFERADALRPEPSREADPGSVGGDTEGAGETLAVWREGLTPGCANRLESGCELRIFVRKAGVPVDRRPPVRNLDGRPSRLVG